MGYKSTTDNGLNPKVLKLAETKPLQLGLKIKKYYWDHFNSDDKNKKRKSSTYPQNASPMIKIITTIPALTPMAIHFHSSLLSSSTGFFFVIVVAGWAVV